MSDVYYVDGQFVTAQDAVIPVRDLAVLRGYGVFDVTRTYNHEPFHLEDHIDRLFKSAAAIELDVPWTPEEINAIVREAVSRSTHAENAVRMVITGGDTITSLTPTSGPRLLVLVNELMQPPDASYLNGIRMITVPDGRALTNVKSIDYIPAIRARKQATRKNAVDALYVDPDGNVREATTANLFAFIDDTLVTPNEGVLDGVTRQVVLGLADGLFETEMRKIPLDELMRADEVFITGSMSQILPVQCIDNQPVADGKPGRNTHSLMEAFTQLVKKQTFPGIPYA